MSSGVVWYGIREHDMGMAVSMNGWFVPGVDISFEGVWADIRQV